METRTINLSSENYPVVSNVVEMAAQENRSVANMADTLLKEAIATRKAKEQKTE